MRYYACESTPSAKVYAQDRYHPGHTAEGDGGGDGGRDDGWISRDSERRGERERLMKSSLTNSSTQDMEPRRQRVSSGSQLATVNTPWSRSSG